ncbi:hypothetical protein H4R34_006259, partial [Dimargaris verticillata]
MQPITVLVLTLAVLGRPLVVSSMQIARNVTFFTPERPHAVYVTDTAAPALPLLPEPIEPAVRALSLAKALYALQDDDIVVKDNHVSEDVGVTHIYLRQRLDGREIANADMNVNIDADGNILSYGSSFISQPAKIPSIQAIPSDPEDQAQTQGPINAIQMVLQVLGYATSQESAMVIESHDNDSIAVANVPSSVEPTTIVRPVYLVDGESKLVPTWEVTLHTLDDWVV